MEIKVNNGICWICSVPTPDADILKAHLEKAHNITIIRPTPMDNALAKYLINWTSDVMH